jgi:hypothetical protein
MSLDISLYYESPDELHNYVFDANITHNLNRMADAAGFYRHLWRGDEIDVTKAHQLIFPLKAGIAAMIERPSYFRQFEPDNKWGTYDKFLPWLANLLEACVQNPDAFIHRSR